MITQTYFCQSYPGWKGYFSFNNIVDVTHSPEKVIAATENALFKQNIYTNDLETFTSVDGLKSETITAAYYSETAKITFLGNKNGLLILVKADGKILQKRGILDEVPVASNIKRINSFTEHNGKVYIATDYGISEFRLDTLEFGDTFYIGNSGEALKILQTAIYNNEIYAVISPSGIKKAAVTNSNLVDFSQWTTFDSGSWTGITNFNNQLIGANTDGNLYKYNGTSFQTYYTIGETIKILKSNQNYLVATCSSKVLTFDTSNALLATITVSQFNFDTTETVYFTSGIAINNYVYVGTNNQGLVKNSLQDTNYHEIILPNGPIQNYVFRVKKAPNKLWITYGGFSPNNFEPNYSLKPLSFYDKNGWDYFPITDLHDARSLTDIAINPKDENELFVGSWHTGLLHIKDQTIELFNDTTAPPNSPEVQAQAPGFYNIRTSALKFDKDNNLWFVNSLVASKLLKSRKPSGQWTSIDFQNKIIAPYNENIVEMVVDKNGTKWMACTNFQNNGVVAYNESTNKILQIKMGAEGNLPYSDIRALAIDLNNQLWIGTSKGLRYVSNVNQFLDATEIQSKNIVIEEGNNAEELFYEQFIVDIEVDGANQKWVSLADAGVYLISPDGQNTIYKFTKDNSPLPSNNINDIDIDGTTGEVYFATDKGLVSFQAMATAPQEDLSQAYVYPNPVRPEYTGTVKIAGLSNKANVKITDVQGNLVYETTSVGGTLEWDTTAFGKYKVATGVYMVFLAGEDGIDTNVAKIMIIR